MGEAFTAVAEDASAAHWNPAGLAQIPRASLTLMYADYVAGINYQHLSYAQRLSAISVLGGAIQLLDAGKITRTNAVGAEIGSFQPRDMILTLSYARDLDLVAFENEGFSFGVSAKLLRSTIVNTDQAVVFDLGVLGRWRTFGDRPLRLAFAMSNFGQKIQYDINPDNLPETLKVGGALQLAPWWLLTADWVVPRYNAFYGAFGTEYALKVGRNLGIYGRAGVNTQGLRDLTGQGGYSYGGGLRLALLHFDYAFVPLGDLGQTHRISLTLQFPGELLAPEPSLFEQQRRLLEP